MKMSLSYLIIIIIIINFKHNNLLNNIKYEHTLLPLCVNVFSTGKVVVLGLKSLDFNDMLDKIILYMHMFVQ